MAFRQLYYTSCEHGLLGYGGFQFNAATPGVPPDVLREIEDLTAYEPPRWMPADPAPGQLAGYPVALSRWAGGDGSQIVARVVFAGADYTGRPGNYFAHVLVTDSAADFGGVLPAELWQAPFWSATPAATTELPPLAAPLAAGPLSRAGVAESLAESGPAVLPRLVTAAGQALAGGRPVLLAGPDDGDRAAWIAAVCYLLGPLAGTLSFTTYSHRPAYCRHHLIGVLTTGAQAPSPDQGFQVFDPHRGTQPEDPAHPLADLLTRAGVMQAAPLWQQAQALAAGAEDGLDGWYPVVAAAVVLRGGRLDPGRDVPVVAGWLAGAGHRPPDTGRVLQALVDGYGDELAPDQLAMLHPLAGELGPASLLDALEGRLIDAALAQLERGEVTAALVRLASPRARSRAARQCLRLLGTALPPASVPGILNWAAQAGAPLPDAELRRYGQEHLDPWHDRGDLAGILLGQPEIVAGFLARLARLPAADAQSLFEDPGLFAHGEVITRRDLESQPELIGPWILGERAREQLSPLAALKELLGLRPPRLDEAALRKLWPRGCPAADLRRILEPVWKLGQRDWLAEQIGLALSSDTDDGAAALVAELRHHPQLSRQLPAQVIASANSLAAVMIRLRGARDKVRRGDTKVLLELCGLYADADRKARKMLEQEVPGLLCDTERLDQVVPACPEPIRHLLCLRVREDLAPFKADPVLAARIFRSAAVLRDRGEEHALDDLMAEFGQVLKWPGGKRRALRREMSSEEADEFEQWCEENRPGAMVKIRGLLRTRRDGD
jgi:hypothetical protein